MDNHHPDAMAPDVWVRWQNSRQNGKGMEHVRENFGILLMGKVRLKHQNFDGRWAHGVVKPGTVARYVQPYIPYLARSQPEGRVSGLGLRGGRFVCARLITLFTGQSHLFFTRKTSGLVPCPGLPRLPHPERGPCCALPPWLALPASPRCLLPFFPASRPVDWWTGVGRAERRHQ